MVMTRQDVDTTPLVPVLVLLGMVAAIVGSLGAPLVVTISEQTHVSLADAQWSLTISLLVGAVSTPVMGRLGDGPHRRDVVVGGLLLVLLGSVVCALPLSFGWLVAGRALMGVGLGLTPLAMAAARDGLVGERQRSAVAVLSVTTVAGIGVGYPLAGCIAAVTLFRAAFWLGAAVSVLALVAALRVFPETTGRTAHRLDVAGALLLGTGVAGLLVTLSELPAWSAVDLLLLGGGSVLVLGVWIVVELRVTHPLVDLRLVPQRSVLTADVSALLAGVGMYTLLSLVVRFVQTPVTAGYGFGASAGLAGLVLLPFSAMSLVATRVGPVVTRWWGARAVTPIGCAVVAGALGAFVLDRSHLAEVFVVMGLGGLGTGLVFAAVPSLVVRGVAASETGSAMSFNQVLRYVGYSLGSAFAATVLQAATQAGQVLPEDGGYTVAGLIGVGAIVAAGVLAAVLPGRAPAADAAPVVHARLDVSGRPR